LLKAFFALIDHPPCGFDAHLPRRHSGLSGEDSFEMANAHGYTVNAKPERKLIVEMFGNPDCSS